MISSNTARRKVSILMKEEVLHLPGLKIPAPSSDDNLKSDNNKVLIKEQQKILRKAPWAMANFNKKDGYNRSVKYIKLL